MKSQAIIKVLKDDECLHHITVNHKCQPAGGARGKSLAITEVIKIHHPGTINTYTKFHDNPSNS